MTPQIGLRAVVYLALFLISLAILYVFLSYRFAKNVADPEPIFHSEPTPGGGDTPRI